MRQPSTVSSARVHDSHPASAVTPTSNRNIGLGRKSSQPGEADSVLAVVDGPVGGSSAADRGAGSDVDMLLLLVTRVKHGVEELPTG
ncbi:hypothetical protein JCM3263A_05380 [Thermobifida fusca]